MFNDCKWIGEHAGQVCKLMMMGVVMSIVIVVEAFMPD